MNTVQDGWSTDMFDIYIRRNLSGVRKKQPYVTLSITLSADHSAGFILTAFSPPQSPTPSAYRLIATQPPGAAAGVSGRADSEARSRDDSSVYLHDGGGHSPKARSQTRWLFTERRLVGKLTVINVLLCSIDCDWCSDRCTCRPLRTAQRWRDLPAQKVNDWLHWQLSQGRTRKPCCCSFLFSFSLLTFHQLAQSSGLKDCCCQTLWSAFKWTLTKCTLFQQ